MTVRAPARHGDLEAGAEGGEADLRRARRRRGGTNWLASMSPMVDEEQAR